METERLSPSITNWNTLLCLAYSPRRVVLPPNSHEVILKATAQGKVFRLFAFFVKRSAKTTRMASTEDEFRQVSYFIYLHFNFLFLLFH